MSRRRTLLWRTVLACSIPVIGVAAFVIWRETAKDAPYVAGKEQEGITRALDRDFGGGAAPIRLTDVTAESGIEFRHFPYRRTSQLPEDMGSGAAWGDYDGDGRDDLFLVNFAAPVGTTDQEVAESPAIDRLYRNLGNGTFEDVTAAAGVGVAHRGMGARWADYDADGDLDLIVTSWGDNILWENRGDGTFVDVTKRAGLLEKGFWTGASWSDFDLDGDLDLYVCGYVRYDAMDPAQVASSAGDSDFPFTLNPSSWPAHPNRFWVNVGGGKFEERGEAAGIAGANGKSLCAAWADFDADGLPDLYVANDVSDNAMYHNRGDGTFEDVSYQAVVADYRGAMGIAVGDWDGDLDLDLFITHWIAQENALYSNQLSDFGSDGADDGALIFVDDADRVGLGQVALDLIGWGTDFVDLDCDGRLDLFVTNGSTFQMRDDPSRLVTMDPHLYWNRGAEAGFFEIGEQAGIRSDSPGVGRGAAVSDYDGDGDPDLLLCRHGGSPRLLRNDSVRGNAVTLRLRASSGHPSGVGSRLVVHAGDRAWLREAGAGASYISGHSADVFVGLGGATAVDSIVIDWVGGGREVHRDLETERTWVLAEGERPTSLAWARPGALRSRRTSGLSDRAVVADVSTDLSRDQIREFWSLKKQADRLLLDWEWSEAVDVLTEMAAINPRHEDTLYSLGNAYLELGRPTNAAAAWRSLLRVNPAAARAWVQLGVLQSQPDAGELFDLDAAAHSFESAHELNREHSGPLIFWGEVEVARGDLTAAEEILTSAFRMNDKATSALYLTGYVAWKRGDDERARELLDEAVRSLEEDVPIQGVAGEGDTRSDDMKIGRERAARRRLFAECVAALRIDATGPDLDTAYARVDESRRALPEPRTSAP